MQSFSALSIRARFVFGYLLCYLTFSVLSGYFFLSRNLVVCVAGGFLKISSLYRSPHHVKLRANGCNLVGCYMLSPFEHPVACRCMLLRVVGSCCIRLHNAANMDATTPNIVGQQFWGLLRSFVGSLREYEKVLLMESGILGFGIRNTAQAIRKPTYDWNPEPKLH